MILALRDNIRSCASTSMNRVTHVYYLAYEMILRYHHVISRETCVELTKFSLSVAFHSQFQGKAKGACVMQAF